MAVENEGLAGTMKCVDIEELLADYLDGGLTPSQRSGLEAHLAGCTGCASLAADATAAAAFLKEAKETRDAEVAIPPALVRQILEATTRRPRGGFLSRLFGVRISGVLQPRWVMSLAMAALSVVMVGRFWETAEHTAYRAWNRTIRHYENLAVVDNVQNQLDDLRSQLERK